MNKFFSNLLRNAIWLALSFWQKQSKPDDANLFCFSNDYISRQIISFGRYEAAELSWVKKHILDKKLSRSSDIVVDVGANIGNHSVYFSLCGFKVVSVEPHPVLSKVLQANLQINGCHQASVEQVAFGDRDGELSFELNTSGNLGGSRIISTAELTSNPALTVVNVRKGTDVLGKYHSANSRIGLIKIDVEGYEVPALKGLKAVIEGDKPLILFEGNSIEERRQIVECLRNFGYNRFGALLGRPEYSKFRVWRWVQRISDTGRVGLFPLEASGAGDVSMCVATCSAWHGEVLAELNS
jgi:FkbM family methyltransferase